MKIIHKAIGINLSFESDKEYELNQAIMDRNNQYLINEMVAYREEFNFESSLALEAVINVLNERIRLAKLYLAAE